MLLLTFLRVISICPVNLRMGQPSPRQSTWKDRSLNKVLVLSAKMKEGDGFADAASSVRDNQGQWAPHENILMC